MSFTTAASRLQRQLRREKRRCLPASFATRNERVLTNLGLAYLATSRQLGRGPGDHDDLLQEAHLGLIQCAERFDANRGIGISSYALRLATGQIQHYRRDRSAIVHIPWRLNALYAKASQLQELRLQRHLPPLSDQQLACAMGVSVERWHQAQMAHQQHHIVSLHAPSGGDDRGGGHVVPTSLLDELPAHPGQGEQDPQLAWLRRHLPHLPHRFRDWLIRHHVDGLSARSIAAEDGIPVAEIRSGLHQGLSLLQSMA